MSKKEKCKTCKGNGTVEYYHDAGDHFGAGSSPWSEWVIEPCSECEKRAEAKARKRQMKEMERTLKPAIDYANSLDW